MYKEILYRIVKSDTFNVYRRTKANFYIYYWRRKVRRLKVCRTLTAILRIRKWAQVVVEPVCREVKLCQQVNLQAGLNKLVLKICSSYMKYFHRNKMKQLLNPNSILISLLNLSSRDILFKLISAWKFLVDYLSKNESFLSNLKITFPLTRPISNDRVF